MSIIKFGCGLQMYMSSSILKNIKITESLIDNCECWPENTYIYIYIYIYIFYGKRLYIDLAVVLKFKILPSAVTN